MSYLGQQLGQGQAERWVCTATAGQTTITVGDDGRSIAYTPPQVDVYLNGSKQVVGSDVTATTGTSLVFASGLTAGDVVDVVALSVFNAADTVSRSLGGTFLGAVNFPSGGLNVGSGQLRVDSSGRVLTPNRPSFFARPSTDPTTGVVVCTLVDYNIGSHYNSSTGRFTAPVDGLYYFSAITNGGVGTGGVALRFTKNGTTIPGFQAYIMNVDDSPNISGAVQLAAGDWVDLRTDVSSIAATPWTHFAGFMVS